MSERKLISIHLRIPVRLLNEFDKWADQQVRDRSSLIRELMAERIGVRPDGTPLDPTIAAPATQ